MCSGKFGLVRDKLSLPITVSGSRRGKEPDHAAAAHAYRSRNPRRQEASPVDPGATRTRLSGGQHDVKSENSDFVDQKREAIVQSLAADAAALARQGSVQASWRVYRGRRLQPLPAMLRGVVLDPDGLGAHRRPIAAFLPIVVGAVVAHRP